MKKLVWANFHYEWKNIYQGNLVTVTTDNKNLISPQITVVIKY